MNEGKDTSMKMKQELHDLLGYGKKFSVVVGFDPETKKEKIEEFHMSPVSLKDLPELQESLNSFFNATSGTSGNVWTDETIKQAGNVIVLSLKRMHPEITLDEVLEKFGLGGLAKAVKIAMDLNNFLSEMGEIKKSVGTMETMMPQS